MRSWWVGGSLVLGLGLVGCHDSYGPEPKPSGEFAPPAGALVVGYRETTVHRLPEGAGSTVIRGSNWPGIHRELGLWLNVDATGRVVNVKGDTAVRDDVNRAKAVAMTLRFRPFGRGGMPSPAWVQETVVWETKESVPSLPAWNVPGCVGVCDSVDGNGGVQAALGRAVLAGRVDEARRLVASVGSSAERFSGWWGDGATYLMLAEGSGIWEMVEDAMSRPHDVNARDAKGRTALDWVLIEAPEAEDIFPLIDGLLGAGADRRALDRVLADTCEPEWIKGLVARGANVNARNAQGQTALFDGCPVDAVKALLAAGADPQITDDTGRTAIAAVYGGERDPRAAAIGESLKSKK